MKRTILTTTVTMIASFAMAAAAIAAPMQPLTTTKECTVISVGFYEGDLILNLADTEGNLYQYKEAENFYFDSPVPCTVTITDGNITAVDFE